jgi:ABC-type uncharacterized transport system permease subunit
MSLSLLYLLAFLLYAGLALYFWRSRATQGESKPLNLAEKTAILVPIVLHAWLLHRAMLGGTGINLNLANAFSATVLLAAAVYWLGNLRLPLHGLQSLVLALAAVAVTLPHFIPVPHPVPHTEFPAFRWHLLISFLAYSLFTVAALHAAVMSYAEKALHHAVPPPLVAGLPPLLTLEKMLFRIIGAGFVLLTLTVASGMLFSEEVFHKPLQFNHKTVFGLASWLIFGGLLLGRAVYGWRGRTAIRWTLAGFVMLMLAYLGTKFVLEVILAR